MPNKKFNIIAQGLLASVLFTVTSLASAGGMGGDGGMGPQPAALSYTEPSPAGIPYRWHVTMNDQSWTEFKNYVGAKSWWEPKNPPATPGWTHTSNWVDLELQNDAYVEIDVEAESGIPCTGVVAFACDSTLVAGSNLYPAISLYKGVDTSSAQDHVFNPVGNFSWSSVQYLDSQKSKGKHSLTYKTKLPAGSYTLNIGGAAFFYCQPTDTACFTGGQGYKASITTMPVHGHH